MNGVLLQLILYIRISNTLVFPPHLLSEQLELFKQDLTSLKKFGYSTSTYHKCI